MGRDGRAPGADDPTEASPGPIDRSRAQLCNYAPCGSAAERLRRALAHAVSESARHLSLIRPIPTAPAHVKRSASMREVTSAPLDRILQ